MGERLEQIRERLEAASEPVLSTWVCFDGWGPPPDGERMRAAAISDGQSDVVAPHPRGEEIIAREEDLEFICYATSDLRYLLNRIEAQAEVVEAAREAVWALKEARAFVLAIPATTSKELDRRQRRLAEALDNLEEQTDD